MSAQINTHAIPPCTANFMALLVFLTSGSELECFWWAHRASIFVMCCTNSPREQLSALLEHTFGKIKDCLLQTSTHKRKQIVLSIVELMSLFSLGLFSVYPIPFYCNNLPCRWHSHHTTLSVPHTMTAPEYSQLLTVSSALTKALCELPHSPCCRAEDGNPQLFVWSVHSCLFTDQKIRYVFLCGRIPPLFLPLLCCSAKNNIFFACFYIFGLRFKCQ